MMEKNMTVSASSRPLLASIFSLPLLLLCSLLTHAQVISLQVDESKQGRVIPKDFLGFSYEKNVLALDHFQPSNAAMLRLMQHLGPGVLRFGGNYVEITRWQPEDPKSFSNQKSNIGRKELADVFAFARACEWKVIHGLNLGANDPAMAAAEAAEVQKLQQGTLLAFEIGNEPEHFGKVWRPEGYAYADFQREVASYLAALRPQGKTIPLAGPATTSNFPWFTGFIRDFSQDLVMTTRHNYPLAAANQNPTDSRFATIENLLSRNTAREWVKLMAQHQNVSAVARLPYRIAEAGSASSGGKAGVSDVFASALWCADYCFSLAEIGVAGVNFHSSFNRRGYTSFSAMKGGQYHIHPHYYGMLFFRQAAQGTFVPVTASPSEINLTTYACLAKDGTLRIALINKDLKRDATVSLPQQKRASQAAVMRLTAPTLQATTDVTLGEASVTPDGHWQPKPLTRITADKGHFKLHIPAGSAALLVMDPAPLGKR
jgi:hypothetical protein